MPTERQTDIQTCSSQYFVHISGPTYVIMMMMRCIYPAYTIHCISFKRVGVFT